MFLLFIFAFYLLHFKYVPAIHLRILSFAFQIYQSILSLHFIYTEDVLESVTQGLHHPFSSVHVLLVEVRVDKQLRHLGIGFRI
jgi:hypothetical protein